MTIVGFSKFNRTVTPKWVSKNVEKIRFDLAIQRNEVWDSDRKSLFIHSLIVGYSIPYFYAQDNGDDYLWMLDGKQRMTTIYKFMNGEFELSPNTPNVGEIEVAGLKYEDLPEEFKDEILTTNLYINTYKNMTEDERDEMFLRLNNGMALTKIELTRVMASSKIMDYVKEIAQKQFFKTIVLNDNQRNRFIDEELILQIMSLVYENNAVSLSSKSIAEFALKIKEIGISDEQMEMMRKVSDYLNDALPIQEKFMKKINIPMIFFCAKKAIEDGVSHEKFGGFIQKFFSGERGKSISFKYNDATSSSSAKIENVRIRLNEILTVYLDTKKFPIYKKPEEKEVRARGRKSSPVVTYNLNDEANDTKDKVENVVNNTMSDIIDNIKQEEQGEQKTDFISYVTPESKEVQTEVVV